MTKALAVQWHTTKVVLQREVEEALANRWLLAYAALMGLLVIVVSYAGYRELGQAAFQGLGRTTASLLGLASLLVSVTSLVLGATAIVGERERGTLATQLAQPISWEAFLVGKFLGQAMALTMATSLGLGVGGLVVALLAPLDQAALMLVFLALMVGLGTAMLGTGYLVSVVAGDRVHALLAAVALWFWFVLVMDLVALGAVTAAHLNEASLWALLLLNPVEVVRLLAILWLEPDPFVLGPLGSFVRDTLGVEAALAALAAALVTWIVAPLAGAAALFRRQEI
jgi:ABC-type transport system involved in multi-copper enzyme maturation permease subunit